ncbi:glycosyltransferase family 61 protein [Paracoccus marinaquae]|uniref:Glycosyltransferase family 61 protein n=1 Tax=Paracoccus marinaquae TaxID=2841926 RepID=A0ABS6AL09_9RHOB|nr:glycosyltransferase 61 family protein [Paracoccus marinaquae]MBU3031276.1 glycosyltransferase family 61 protein [Paracoccus marinaquae]
MTQIRPGDIFPVPEPDQGWSREVMTVDDAIVWPAGPMQRIPMCGITHADGRDCPEAAIYRGDTRMMAPVAVETRPQPAARLPGTHLWGGQVFAHFGHFMTETIPRLWASTHAGVESIVFIGKHEQLQKFSPWQQDFLALLGMDLPVTFVTEPTRIERLMVPGQGFGLGRIARGTPEFRAFIGRLQDRIEPKGAERIYVSRTKTGKKGRVLNEYSIEQNLIAQGYTAYHPQDHSPAEQLAQYMAATHVIGLDSSAFHLLGFMARPGQRVAVVLRRNMMAYVNIQRQLEGMLGRSPDIINVLLGDWMPPRQKGANRESWGQVDHHRLVARLTDLGYLDRPEAWTYPDEKDFNIAFAKFRKRMGGEVVFRPVEVPIEKIVAAARKD